MNIELLNIWINDLGFYIKDDTLYLKLKVPLFRRYSLQLSLNKNDILDFFGFDATFEYDNMTERNQFEYLCTSTKLLPSDICHYTFKDFPNSKQHARFDEYLKKKYNAKQLLEPERKTIWRKDAIRYFKKENEYDIYLSQCDMCLRAKKLSEKLNVIDMSQFFAFIMLYGLKNIIEFDETTLFNKWDVFSHMNWSHLSL